MGVSSRDAESWESTSLRFDADIGERSGSDEPGGAWLMLMGAPWGGERPVREGVRASAPPRHAQRAGTAEYRRGGSGKRGEGVSSRGDTRRRPPAAGRCDRAW